jgi:hypothetical protein
VIISLAVQEKKEKCICGPLMPTGHKEGLYGFEEKPQVLKKVPVINV